MVLTIEYIEWDGMDGMSYEGLLFWKLFWFEVFKSIFFMLFMIKTVSSFVACLGSTDVLL